MTSYEFDHQTGRFRVRACGDGGWAIIDTRDGGEVEIGTDVCEPEDALLVRDLAWVRDALNTVDAAAQKRIGELDAIRAEDARKIRDLEARVAALERSEAHEIAERENREEQLTDLAIALGCREEWSNVHDHGECWRELLDAALAQARAEGFREGVEALRETADALADAADVAAVAWGHERVCSTCAEESPPDCLKHPNAGTSDPAITLDGALAAYRATLLPDSAPKEARKRGVAEGLAKRMVEAEGLRERLALADALAVAVERLAAANMESMACVEAISQSGAAGVPALVGAMARTWPRAVETQDALAAYRRKP